MGENSTAEAVPQRIAMLGGAAALATTLFGVMGFLSTRSYLSGLGIPAHASVSLDNYVQYGGRLVFVLAVHLLPVGSCTALLLLLAVAVRNHWAWLRGMSDTLQFMVLALIAAALVTILLELMSLEAEPVFLPGRVRDPGVSRYLRSMLYLTELAAAVTFIWFVRWFGDLWRSYWNTIAGQTLLSFALLLVLISLLLFPLCFGRIAMMPGEFDQVTLRREKDQPALSGILVFSDADSYFLFGGERKLIEVPHHTVKEIQYESLQRLENLANR